MIDGISLFRLILTCVLIIMFTACTRIDSTPSTASDETSVVVVSIGTIEPAVTAVEQPSPLPIPTRPTTLPTTIITTQAPEPTKSVLTVAVRRQIFQEVWSIIDKNYLYADFGGVDWAAIRREFEPRIAQVTSDEAFYQLIELMVGRLNDHHSRFMPPQLAQRQDVLSSGREEQVGIGVITLDRGDGLLLRHVFADSPAARAGLRPRDRIVSINGIFYTNTSLQGPEGSEVRLTVVRPGEKSRDIVLTRAHVEGQITPLARRLADDIGYIAITTLWVSDMDVQVSRALADISAARPLRGLILDLRSNPGGWRNVLTGILSHFTRGEVGMFTSRQGNTALRIPTAEQPNVHGLPLVVLVDGGTASYAELIAAVLQERAGATVIGTPTAGNTETIYSYELTGGARLWVAQEGFRLPDGRNLEGVGVVPDLQVIDDWTRFSETDDPAIRSALRLLIPHAGGR